MAKLSAVERERTKLRERKRRAVTTKIFQGLRRYGNYNLAPRADINEVLRALAEEAGWIVEADGTTYRNAARMHDINMNPSTSMSGYGGIVVPFTGDVNPNHAGMETLRKSSVEADFRGGGQGNPLLSTSCGDGMVPTFSAGTLNSKGFLSRYFSLENCTSGNDNLAAQQNHWEVKQEQMDGSLLRRSEIMESGEGFGRANNCTGSDATAIAELSALINLKMRSAAARHYEECLAVSMAAPRHYEECLAVSMAAPPLPQPLTITSPQYCEIWQGLRALTQRSPS